MAVRRVSLHFAGPALTATISETGSFRSRSRTASSIESSSKGLSECLRPDDSIAVLEEFIRGLT